MAIGKRESQAGAWRSQVIWLVVLASCGNPMSGLRFACDPDGPSTCLSGYVCVRVEPGLGYEGVCTPASAVGDPGQSDPGESDETLSDPGPDRVEPEADAADEPDIVCVPEHHNGCLAGNVHWFDSYGLPGEKTADCARGCVDGKCIDCTPDCASRECGDDGCGGDCGTCPTGSCDGLTWNRPRTCVGGLCTGGGGAESCDDGNVCTDDGCDPVIGCLHEVNLAECAAARCESGNYYPASRCFSGMCPTQTGEPCNDGNVCTDDGCATLLGCVHLANTQACDDGNACTTGDTCSGGQCAGGPALNCDDGKTCTDGACSPAVGCSNTLKSGWCLIDGACDGDGQPGPGDPCRVCSAAKAPDAWSDAPAGTACGTNAICVAGICESTCCDPADCPPPGFRRMTGAIAGWSRPG